MQVRHILLHRAGRHHFLSLNLIRFTPNNSDLTELKNVTTATLKEGLTLKRCGKLRILHIASSGLGATLSAADRPALDITGMMYMISGTTRFPAYVVINASTGDISGNYFSGTTTQDVGSNLVRGQVVWFAE